MMDLRNVSLAYDGNLILSGINCILEQNEFICIIGNNGSGKSTLLRAAMGLMPYKGSIRLNNAEINSLSHKDRAKRLSFLPQTRPIPVMDVNMLIAHGRYPHLGFSKILSITDKELVVRAAKATNITHLIDRDLSTLSGGERQRAYIAMMVAQDADFMLLDEPTTHLDIKHQLEVMDLLKSLNQSGKGIVMAAHDLPQAFSYATRVLLIADGGIAAMGKPEELCENKMIEYAFGVTVKKTIGTDDLYAYNMTKGARSKWT